MGIDGLVKNCEQCSNCGIYYDRMLCTLHNKKCLDIIKYNNSIQNQWICPNRTPLTNLNTSKLELDKAYKFMLGGNSEFSCLSLATGKELTYKLIRINTAGCIRSMVNADENKSKAMELSSLNSGVFVYRAYFKQYNSYINIGTIWYNTKLNRFESRSEGVDSENNLTNIIFVLNKLKSPAGFNKLKGKLEIYTHIKCSYCGREIDTIKELKHGIHLKCRKLIRIP